MQNKQELQQNAFNYSLNLRNLLIFTKKLLGNHIFLVIDATLASATCLSLRKNYLERI